MLNVECRIECSRVRPSFDIHHSTFTIQHSASFHSSPFTLHSSGEASRAGPRQPPTRPRPLEVVAADLAIDVEDLAAEEKAGADPRGHRPHIDLRQRYTAGRDLGIIEP